MKKLILSLALIGAVATAIATGDFPNNSLQTGQITLTTLTGNTWTNVFPIPYTYVPIVTITPTSTNGAPYTLTSVSTTNFVVSSTANTPTNCTFYWSSTLPNIRIQTGTNTLVGATPLVVAFPVAYAYPPIVTANGSSTNGEPYAAINFQSTTTTNFTVLGNVNTIITWSAIGSCFQPGANTVTY